MSLLYHARSDSMSMSTFAGLVMWFLLLSGFVYASRNRGIKSTLVILFFTVIAVSVIEFIGSTINDSDYWIWFIGVTIFGILCGWIRPRYSEPELYEKSIRNTFNR